MSAPRAPLTARKLRQVRGLLLVATAVVGAGTAVTVAGGGGVWELGLAGWAAIVVAVVTGAGPDNTRRIIGWKGARWPWPDGASAGRDRDCRDPDW
jgi:hypothetical protein